jgi:hypothetical protein
LETVLIASTHARRVDRALKIDSDTRFDIANRDIATQQHSDTPLLYMVHDVVGKIVTETLVLLHQ